MKGYRVAIGQSWHAESGKPSPDYDCGHAHRTLKAACACGEKLYGAGYKNGSWSANAKWHNWFVIGPDGERAQS